MLVRVFFVLLVLRGVAVGYEIQIADGPRLVARELPGTNGEWYEVAAEIPASPARIRGWLVDYQGWPANFPDIEWSEVRGQDAQGRNIIRFRSRIADAVLTVHEAVTPNLLVFEGWATFAYTQGRIHLLDLGDGRTRVVMQSAAEGRGLAKLFATKRLKQKRSFQVAASHLWALWRLAERVRGD
jgi:hypothetical protein